MKNATSLFLACFLACSSAWASQREKAVSASGATIVWKGGNASEAGAWQMADNWVGGTIPSNGDEADVNNPPACDISEGTKACVGRLNVGCGGSQVGTLVVKGKGSSLTARAGYIGDHGRGVFTQGDGTVVFAERLSFGLRAGKSGYGTYHGTGGTLTIGDNLSIGGGYATASQGGNGEFHIDGVAVSVGQHVYSGSGKIKGLGRGCGTIKLTAGRLSVGGDFFNSHHMWSKELPGGQKHRGRLIVSGGRADVAGNFHNGFSPEPSRVEGVVEIIGAGGTVTIAGNFFQNQDSTLIAELAGKDHTMVRVEGNAALGGVFKVRLAKGFTPASGTWWTIVGTRPDKPGSMNGTFSTLDFSEAGGAEHWKVQYDTDANVFRVGYVRH